ncbi:response regulator [Dyadobacter sp. 676]|uniref:Response regulator n=1 Tax=Dyadobacter sp. 676 TaxID=3088362 RepID=A0AAU8FJ95_9BACT
MTSKELNSRFNILVVDDNRDMLLITSSLLKISGFRTQTCESGPRCIAMTEAEVFDAVILDIEMSDMDGFAVCEHIRAQPWGKLLPIIAYTGHKEDIFQKYPGKSAFTRFLAKPATIEELSKAIHDAISAMK